MGAEATCTVRFKRTTAEGKARLETDVLQFRGGELKLSIAFAAITAVEAAHGILSVTFPDGTATFALGADAERWAAKIKNPPTRLTKIGVRPTWQVSAIGYVDPAFLAELEASVAHLSIGHTQRGSDAIFFAASSVAELARLRQVSASLKPDGALWIIRPKGDAKISERAVMEAGRAAGLVDVKVVAFSATHTAEKFVIPVAKR